ncbi:MerR family regulatory protein [Arthrobacter saudimassiliensis]|uniref:MerR family regulatory protein n=1 Tax=Arthrobacter saudimassiliensis TaxID=1461584 RepID=A0A078MPT7_9MICC|nr:MerR family regulatory protein [Arthrobacter saudimassiliensis]
MRALRHYHQTGLLAEPPRSSNGYREYDVHALIRVLRIRRLAALGLPLEQMPPLLDEPEPGTGPAGATVPGPDAAEQALEELDRELAAAVERLTEQRRLIARIRADRNPPDVPPELARFLRISAGTLPARIAKMDREQLVLLGHLGSENVRAAIGQLFDVIASPGFLEPLTVLMERFDALPADAPSSAVDALAADLATALEPASAALAAHDGAELDGRSLALFNDYAADVLNPAQLAVLQRVGGALEDA